MDASRAPPPCLQTKEVDMEVPPTPRQPPAPERMEISLVLMDAPRATPVLPFLNATREDLSSMALDDGPLSPHMEPEPVLLAQRATPPPSPAPPRPTTPKVAWSIVEVPPLAESPRATPSHSQGISLRFPNANNMYAPSIESSAASTPRDQSLAQLDLPDLSTASSSESPLPHRHPHRTPSRAALLSAVHSLSTSPSARSTPHRTPSRIALLAPGRSFSQSMSAALKNLATAAVGDDLSCEDKWVSSSAPSGLRRGSSSSGMMGFSVSMRDAGRESGRVMPLSDDSPSAQDFKRCASMVHAEASSRGFRTLMWYYAQTFLYSIIVALPVLPLVYLLSLVPWSVHNPEQGEGQSVFLPNHTAIQWGVLMQCVCSLALYAVVMYMAMQRSLHVPLPLVLCTGAVIVYALIATSLFWRFDVASWCYYLDVVIIATTYLPVSCMVGWLAAGPDATLRQRIDEVLFVALLEMLVAAATIVYTTFLMPLYFTLISAWLQLLWICIIHPLYFELTTAVIVRKALHRQVALGRTDVVDFLPIVHAMVHLVGLGISLMASIEPIKIMAVSMVMYNVGKMGWRSTVLWRDLLVERIWRWDWSYNYDAEKRSHLGQLISLSVLTEMILENAAIMSSPFMLWCMYKEPIFMTVVPNTFFYNEGHYPIASLFCMLGVMFAVTWISDIAFFALNYYSGQHLPLIYTWRQIKAGKWAYLGFLAYALATMGVMFSFSMMLILPRAAYCHSNDYCDCILPAYKAVCKGEYISMLVDYLIALD